MWRLARQLTEEKNWRIRLWVDRLEHLTRLEPAIDPMLATQMCQQIEVRQWPSSWQPVKPHPIVIAGFSCDLPDEYLKELAAQAAPVWVQLEYLSAEDWVDSFHGLHSHRSDTLKPVFFFPGFNDKTGGLIREQDLLAERDRWLATHQSRPWLATHGIDIDESTTIASVFTYPHAPLHLLIEQLQHTGKRFHLIIPSDAPLPVTTNSERVTCQAIRFLTQPEYDKLLWSCDINLVRGEDSFVRAIWAGKPMIWQIYPQNDGVHHAKLNAWLERAKPPELVAQTMRDWADGELATPISEVFANDQWAKWRQASLAFSAELAHQTTLATRLDTWVRQQTATLDRL